jgi:hypothetical protein
VSDQEAQEVEARQDSDRLEEVRAWGERKAKEAKDLRDQLDEQRQINRASALRTAGVEPDSWTGRVVMAAVEQNDISDPNDIADLVRVVQAENRGATNAPV